jgi:S-adenosylmethionine hydrolase
VRIITLLTDFGLEDGYVASMKGVIAGIAPDARLVDVTHLVPPQDVAFGRFRLLTVAPFFPAGTVHLAVVDPGVGTARRGLAVQSKGGSFFVGPDNGLLTGALEADPAVTAVELTQPSYWRTPDPSPTFHGRDIFSPVAAHLARGAPLGSLGAAIPTDQLLTLQLPSWEKVPGGLRGAIQAVDRFGNAITNVPGVLVSDRPWSVQVAKRSVPGRGTYGDVPLEQPLALVGSHGFVEIAVHGGDARSALGLRVGAGVRIRFA